MQDLVDFLKRHLFSLHGDLVVQSLYRVVELQNLAGVPHERRHITSSYRRALSFPSFCAHLVRHVAKLAFYAEVSLLVAAKSF